MITEDQLEQLAIQWFQDTGKLAARIPSPRPSPTRRGRKAAVREERGNIEHRTLNMERRSEEKRSLAEAVRHPGSRQISQQSAGMRSSFRANSINPDNNPDKASG